MSELWLFLVAATGAMLIPGPDTLVVLRTALGSGVSAGRWAAAGSSIGNLLWGTVSVLGGTAILVASPAGFTALKLAGAAYLVLLGVQALRGARAGADPDSAPSLPARLQPAAALRRGLATDLLNVKVGLFWTALVPQFLKSGATPLLPAAMVASMGALVFAWLSAYAWLAGRILGTLAGASVARTINLLAGLAFLAVGVLLIATR
jgi:threonine/homoserine/homoserine lactone efflux protein